MLHRKTSAAAVAATVALAALTGCSSQEPTPPGRARTAVPEQAVQPLVAKIAGSMPHDPQTFTEGLEIVSDGVMAESSGLAGKSFVQLVEVGSGKVLKKTAYPDGVFGEGLTKVGDELVTLTWKDGKFYRWDAKSLVPSSAQALEASEGWGACYDAKAGVVWTSDGSDVLTARDPKTMKPGKTVKVTQRGWSLKNINELECVDGKVWANIFQSSQLAVIDPANGYVRGTVDLNFVTQQARVDAKGRAFTPDDVMNGLAWDTKTSTMWVTGKRWDRVYQIKIDKLP